MAKSSMGAARMRRSNRRIQHQANAIRKTQMRVYRQQSRQIARDQATAWGKIIAIYQHAITWFGGFFDEIFSYGFDTPLGALGAIKSLNLTIDQGDRGRGARQLRAIFGQQLKMISTRDGKPV